LKAEVEVSEALRHGEAGGPHRDLEAQCTHWLETKRPQMKLPRTYRTGRSTFPLVWARYGRQARMRKPQCRAKRKNFGFSRSFPPAVR
jgi:hypothetical protein